MASTARSRKGKQDVIGPGEFACGPCSADSKTQLAIGYCQFCRHYLCKNCFAYHQNLGRAHVLLDKDTMPREVSTPAVSMDPLLETCREHKHKILELYCKGHDEVCCVICATAKHKNCDYVYIPDFTETLSTPPNEDCSMVLKLIQALIGQLEHVKGESNKRLKDMERQRRDFAMAVRRYRKEIDVVLEQLEKQVLSGMKQVIEINTNDLNEQINKCDSSLEALRNTYKKTESAMESESVNRVFTIAKTSKRQVQENNNVLKEVKDSSYNVDVKFDENFEILKNMRKMKMFGKVSVKKDPVRFGTGLHEDNENGVKPGKTHGPVKKNIDGAVNKTHEQKTEMNDENRQQ
ncbi:E3 ubiquitin-protein ligase TRIM71-like [Mya arenaria]|nr:E3 ubiquitin-protein ligase TRIM71-like [Mya arenaria]XP_052807078.1 E3 ubiquitin-protein ligase TRIM71-like [Mya arenaria]